MVRVDSDKITHKLKMEREEQMSKRRRIMDENDAELHELKTNVRKQLSVLEFYSGIGGWSAATAKALAKVYEEDASQKLSNVGIEIKSAFDINPIANEVFEFNHGFKPNHRSLEHITTKMLDNYNADIWMMSPPCQPFTRNNDTSTRDKVDPRTASFVHLQQLLTNMQHQPKMIFLENVVGFEISECCEDFLIVLASQQYFVQQFHLSPLQFGIPNDRPRYYCIARKATSRELSRLESFPSSSASGGASNDSFSFVDKQIHTSLSFPSERDEPPRKLLHNYLRSPVFSPDEMQALSVPDKVLTSSSGWCLDLRTPHSDYTACFTKSYSRFARGTGSVLVDVDPSRRQLSTEEELHALQAELESYIVKPRMDLSVTGTTPPTSSEDRADWWQRVQSRVPFPIAIRYLAPTELLQLFGFPDSFHFPESLNKQKCYELIGNSINVEVVAHLLQFGLQQLNEDE